MRNASIASTYWAYPTKSLTQRDYIKIAEAGRMAHARAGVCEPQWAPDTRVLAQCQLDRLHFEVEVVEEQKRKT